jgi:hypothetical protein
MTNQMQSFISIGLLLECNSASFNKFQGPKPYFTLYKSYISIKVDCANNFIGVGGNGS